MYHLGIFFQMAILLVISIFSIKLVFFCVREVHFDEWCLRLLKVICISFFACLGVVTSAVFLRLLYGFLIAIGFS